MNNELLNKAKNKFKEVNKIINSQSDELILILRIHLLVESYFDKIIQLLMKRGDFLINAKLSFFHKSCIVKSLDAIPENIITSLQKLNTLRNNCSHELYYQITINDVNSIGNPIGTQYKKIKRNTRQKHILLKITLLYLLGYLEATIQENTDKQ